MLIIVIIIIVANVPPLLVLTSRCSFRVQKVFYSDVADVVAINGGRGEELPAAESFRRPEVTKIAREEGLRQDRTQLGARLQFVTQWHNALYASRTVFVKCKQSLCGTFCQSWKEIRWNFVEFRYIWVVKIVLGAALPFCPWLMSPALSSPFSKQRPSCWEIVQQGHASKSNIFALMYCIQCMFELQINYRM